MVIINIGTPRTNAPNKIWTWDKTHMRLRLPIPGISRYVDSTVSAKREASGMKSSIMKRRLPHNTGCFISFFKFMTSSLVDTF
jgi:hypothetical protein